MRTAGFLISAMHRMLSMAETDQQRKEIKKRQLKGFELQSNMFAVACANMILRRDGNSNLECCDFLAKNPAQVQKKGATVGLMIMFITLYMSTLSIIMNKKVNVY